LILSNFSIHPRSEMPLRHSCQGSIPRRTVPMSIGTPRRPHPWPRRAQPDAGSPSGSKPWSLPLSTYAQWGGPGSVSSMRSAAPWSARSRPGWAACHKMTGSLRSQRVYSKLPSCAI